MIIHPYSGYDDDIDLDSEQIDKHIKKREKHEEVDLQTETKDDIPHGLCFIDYKHD